MWKIYIFIILIFTSTANAKIVNTVYRGALIGSCAVFEKRYKNTTLNICAKEGRNKKTYYYISVNLVGSNLSDIDNSTLYIKQAESGNLIALKLGNKAIHKYRGYIIIGRVVELYEVFIKHIRNGIPIDIEFYVDGQKYDFSFSKEERNEIRMISLIQ